MEPSMRLRWLLRWRRPPFIKVFLPERPERKRASLLLVSAAEAAAPVAGAWPPLSPIGPKGTVNPSVARRLSAAASFLRARVGGLDGLSPSLDALQEARPNDTEKAKLAFTVVYYTTYIHYTWCYGQLRRIEWFIMQWKPKIIGGRVCFSLPDAVKNISWKKRN